MEKKKTDVYAMLTNLVIEDIEKDSFAPWQKPWVGNTPLIANRYTGEAYRGMNQLMTLIQMMNECYLSNTFMTAAQAKNLGGIVKKGEASTKVYYMFKIEHKLSPDAKKFDKEDDEGNKIKFIFYPKYYNVFNVDQIQKLPDGCYIKPADINPDVANKEADNFLFSLGANIKIQGASAFFNSFNDSICIPEYRSFKSSGDFTATLAHEMIHWTGHKSRLDRTLGKSKEDKDYAFEELVAELGALFLCTKLNIPSINRESHSCYLKSWLQAMKGDKKYIFKASKMAQEAVDYIFNLAETNSIKEAA